MSAKSIKLTNYVRDAFINACMCDVPKPDYQALQKEAQDLLYKAMSPAVRKVFRENPKALVHESFFALSDRGRAYLAVGDVNHRDILAPVLEKAEARERVQKSIRQIAYCCGTSKQLEEALPQFAHHVPREREATVNLPVQTTLLADLKTLGFEPKVQVVGEA